MDAADLELFEDSIRRATDRETGGPLDVALQEIGWGDALASDPSAAVAILFERQGFANACSSALDDVLLNAMGLHPPKTAGVVLPTAGGWGLSGGINGDRLIVHGLGTSALAARESAVVVADIGDERVAAVVPLAELTIRPIRGIDPSYGLATVTGETGSGDVEPVDWTAALTLGQLAISHELVGTSRKMLELAREHALQRTQFGRPISQFQAIRHRLADTLLAIETADALLEAAWLDRTPETAAMAKALAGRGSRIVIRHCQQVLAGIGFTTEHALHRFIRRALVLDQLLGSSRALTEDLGRRLLADRKLPPLLPL